MKSSNMNFDGIGDGPKKGSSRFAHNQWSGHSNDGREVNKGRGPTVGNDGSCDTPRNLHGSVTRDSDRRPMTSAVPRLPAQGTVRDNINRGQQDRGAGGVMPRRPSNPDMIRVGQSGGPAYGKTTRGSRPSSSAGAVDFNMGPRSQY